MSDRWAFTELKGLAELFEAALRLDSSLVTLISYADKVLSFPTSSCLAERSIDQLQNAELRANALRERLRQCLVEMGQRLNITVPHDTMLTTNRQDGKAVSALLEFKRLDTIRYIDNVLKLFRLAKGIGASIEVAAEDIQSHLESNYNLEQVGEVPFKHSTNDDDERIIISQPSDDMDDDLLNIADTLRFISGEEIDRLRDLATELRDVRTLLNPTSSDRQVATNSSEVQ